MEKSVEANLPKILLSYEEFERLKHIEEKYIELEKEIQSQKLSQSEVQSEVKTTHFKDEDNRANIQSGKGDSSQNELLPPTAKLEEGSNSNETNEGAFDVTITKNDENSTFDLTQLLELIPSSKKKQAKKLLDALSEVPMELTWNSSGTIFIESIAIPNSNIYLLFPALFKKKKTQLNGYDEFVAKLVQMGLNKYFHLNIPKNSTESESFISSETPTTVQSEIVQWWYIGD